MRLNFNLVTSSGKFPKWFDQLQAEWLDYYQIDTDVTVNQVREFVWSPKGAQLFADWCKEQGYAIEYWEIDYRAPNYPFPIAFGILTNDSCPRLVEYILKNEQ